MVTYKVGYGEIDVEVEAIDMTSAIIKAFKIHFPKSLGVGISVTEIKEGEFNPFIVGSKYIIDLLELPFYDTEEKKPRRKRSWLNRIFR